MTSMTRALAAMAMLLAACSGQAATTTTDIDGPPTTRAPVTTTSTLPVQEVQIQNCSAPPVTFSPLCEIYELLETWYVDVPIDPATLASAAVEGLNQYSTDEVAEPPRTLFCAVPHVAFTPLCDAIADRMETSQIPVGPAVEAAMSHMIDAGLDPFTYYLPPGQTGAFRLNGIVGGVGVLLDARDAVGSKCTTITDVCRLEVVAVLEDNPGEAAGVEVGDLITAIDEQPVDGRGFTAVVAQIAGDETGEVVLTVDRDGSLTKITVERAALSVPTVRYGVPVADVGYIRIPDFELDVPALVTDSLEEIAEQAPSTLVVDLRDNPGGYVDAYVDVADEFVDDGLLMVSEAPDEYLEYPAEPGGAATSPRLLVLVNQGTASAAEILAGTLRDRRGAVLIGSNTFGKDAVQIPFTLRNGGEFYIAVARWSTPSGDTAGDGGLTPDLTVEWPEDVEIEEIIDIALKAAS
jgi:carboxyl-terminal processing protease